MALSFVVLTYFSVMAGLGFGLWLRLRRARDAGASDARPCCVRCWYPLRSWTAPSCPECGSDARINGVAIGPRSGRAFALLLVPFVAGGALVAGLAAAQAIDPVASLDFGRTWVSEKTDVIVRFESAFGGPLRGDSADENWATGTLEVLRRKARPTDPAMQVLHFDSRGRSISLDEVRAALMDAADSTGATEPEEIEQDAVALSLAVEEFQTAIPQRRFGTDSLGWGVTPKGRWTEMSGGGSFSVRASLRSVIVAIVAASLVLVGGMVAAIRFVGPGTRPVQEGEWTSAGRASTAK